MAGISVQDIRVLLRAKVSDEIYRENARRREARFSRSSCRVEVSPFLREGVVLFSRIKFRSNETWAEPGRPVVEYVFCVPCSLEECAEFAKSFSLQSESGVIRDAISFAMASYRAAHCGITEMSLPDLVKLAVERITALPPGK